MKFTLKQWRQIRGLSKSSVSRELGIHVNTYSIWESNPDRIRVGDAIRLCGLLGVTLSDVNFLGEETTKM